MPIINLTGTTRDLSITATFAGLATPQEGGAGDKDGDQEEEEEGTGTSPTETLAVQETSAALRQTTLTS